LKNALTLAFNVRNIYLQRDILLKTLDLHQVFFHDMRVLKNKWLIDQNEEN